MLVKRPPGSCKKSGQFSCQKSARSLTLSPLTVVQQVLILVIVHPRFLLFTWPGCRALTTVSRATLNPNSSSTNINGMLQPCMLLYETGAGKLTTVSMAAQEQYSPAKWKLLRTARGNRWLRSRWETQENLYTCFSLAISPLVFNQSGLMCKTVQVTQKMSHTVNI